MLTPSVPVIFFFLWIGTLSFAQPVPIEPRDSLIADTGDNDQRRSEMSTRKKIKPPLLIRFNRPVMGYRETHDDRDTKVNTMADSRRRRKNGSGFAPTSAPLPSAAPRSRKDHSTGRSLDGSSRSNEAIDAEEYMRLVDNLTERLNGILSAIFPTHERTRSPENDVVPVRLFGMDASVPNPMLGGRRSGGIGDALKHPLVRTMIGSVTGTTFDQDTSAKTTLGGLAGRVADFVTYPILGETISRAARGGVQGATDSIVGGIRNSIFGRRR